MGGGLVAYLLERHFPEAGPVLDGKDLVLTFDELASRADLMPVMRLVFERLKAAGCDWVYGLNEHEIDDFSSEARQQLAEAEPEEQAAADYDPNRGQELELIKEREMKKLDVLDNFMSEWAAEEKHGYKWKPPKKVLAYWEVFGRTPDGFIADYLG